MGTQQSSVSAPVEASRKDITAALKRVKRNATEAASELASTKNLGIPFVNTWSLVQKDVDYINLLIRKHELDHPLAHHTTGGHPSSLTEDGTPSEATTTTSVDGPAANRSFESYRHNLDNRRDRVTQKLQQKRSQWKGWKPPSPRRHH